MFSRLCQYYYSTATPTDEALEEVCKSVFVDETKALPFVQRLRAAVLDLGCFGSDHLRFLPIPKHRSIQSVVRNMMKQN